MKLPAHILLSVIGLLLLATGCLGGRNSEVDMKLLLDELSPEADMSRG